MSVDRARIDRFEADLRRLQHELLELKQAVALDEPPTVPLPPEIPPPPVVPPEPFVPPPPAVPPESPVPPPPSVPVMPGARRPQPAQPQPSQPRFTLPRLDLDDLLGARGLALAGGVVTLLGVVFFFVLAANRGWIGPLERVGLGGIASAAVFAAGFLIHARYGHLHAAVAAAGAGIAGGYATLLAAAALYDLVPALLALVLAAAIAAVGVALSFLWSSEVIASLGLIGALAFPLVVLVDGNLTVLGTGFAAVVLAAAVAVALRQDWRGLFVAAVAVSAPQIATLVLDEGEPARARVIVLAAVFVGVYLASGILRQLAAGGPRLDALGGLFVAGAASLGGLACFALLEDTGRGVAFAALAVVYGLLAAAFWRGETLELASLAASVSTALAAVAAAELLGGPGLVVAWAAEAAVLGWLGRRLAESRFQLLALGYLVVAIGYTLVEEAPPRTLYERGADYAAGIPALLAVAVGAALFGLLARSWPPQRARESMPTFLRELVDDLHAQRPALVVMTLGAAGVLAVDAGSLALLDLFERLDVADPFAWGHLAVTVLWCALALGVLGAGLARQDERAEAAGLAVLAAALASFTIFTLDELPDVRGWAALVLAASCATAAVLHGLRARRARAVAPVSVAVAVPLVLIACFELLSERLEGYGVLAAAAVFAAVAAGVWSARRLATSFWVAALPLGLVASVVLLDASWLVLSWAAAAAALAAAGRFAPEPRLWLASAAVVALSALYVLGELAPPERFLEANDAPAAGVPALVCVCAAFLALLVSFRRLAPADRLDAWLARVGEQREWLFGTLSSLVLYTASLSILGLVEGISHGSGETDLQRGHTVVSALWGTIALVSLVVGLRRRSRVLRLAGLGLFALALGKLFIYDLSTLSSVARALSFLAVGAVLLLAGFFYQRLAEAAPQR